MITEKEKNSEKTEALQVEQSVPQNEEQPKALPDEKNEVDLRELQIKLERLRSYLVKTEGRYKKHEKELELLRAKKEEVAGKRRDAAVVRRAKLDGKV